MRYAGRRLLLAIPTVLLTITLFFFLVRLVPGDVIDARLAETGLSQEQAEELREDYGLKDPVHEQYFNWMYGLLTGDPGDSFESGIPVTETILSRLPTTLELALLAIIVSLLISIPIGIVSAVKQDTIADYTLRSFSILLISVPSFWVATMVLVFGSRLWGWAPQRGRIPITEDPLANLAQFIIPSLILGMFLAGSTMRMTRAMMLEVLQQDFIRTAQAKGLPATTIVLRHALKNALIPVLTIVGIQITFLIGGTVVIEEIFGLQGIGSLFLQAVGDRDYPMLQAICVYIAVGVIIINILVDLAYGYIDPRIRYS